MSWVLYEVDDKVQLRCTPEATLDDSDVISIRHALATVSHKGDSYSKAWHRFEKASDKALANWQRNQQSEAKKGK